MATISREEQYRARKAVRDAMMDADQVPHPCELLDIADRLVTAVERIADAMERKS